MKAKKTIKKASTSKMMYGGDTTKVKMQMGGQAQARTTSGTKKKPKK